MKVNIKEGCIACGLCVATCPDVFAFGDDDLACVISSPQKENEDEVKTAAENCPVSVIECEE